MRCYDYCALVRVAEMPTGENQNSKTWPTIQDQIHPVRSHGREIFILGPWLLDYRENIRHCHFLKLTCDIGDMRH